MRIIDCVQGSPEWMDARCGIPTASCFESIISPVKGEYPVKSAKTYLCELIHERYDPRYGLVDDYISAAMANGMSLEPEARRYYEFDRGVKVKQVGFVVRDDGKAGCSPDSLIGNDGGLEVKCPIAPTHIRYLLDNKLPDEYRPQVHGELAITGREWFDFMSYCRGYPPLLIRVKPDDYTKQLSANLDRFIDELDAAIEKLNLPEPEHDNEPIELPACMAQ